MRLSIYEQIDFNCITKLTQGLIRISLINYIGKHKVLYLSGLTLLVTFPNRWQLNHKGNASLYYKSNASPSYR